VYIVTSLSPHITPNIKVALSYIIQLKFLKKDILMIVFNKNLEYSGTTCTSNINFVFNEVEIMGYQP